MGGGESYQIHHLVEKQISERLGIDLAKVNTTPSINLPHHAPEPHGITGKLQPNSFTPDQVAKYKETWGRDPVYHKGRKPLTDPVHPGGPIGISDAINDLMDVTPDGQEQLLIDGLRKLYTENPSFSKMNAWPAVRDWLRQNSPSGRGYNIPD